MKTKKTNPTLSDYEALVERLCKATERSELEDIYNGFFKTKEPYFPRGLIKTHEDKKLVTGWIDKMNSRISELKKSKKTTDGGHFLKIIAGDLFLGL